MIYKNKKTGREEPLQRTISILREFRELTAMDDIEWKSFCKRYATRDVSTVIWQLKRLYLYDNISPTKVRNALAAELKKMGGELEDNDNE